MARTRFGAFERFANSPDGIIWKSNTIPFMDLAVVIWTGTQLLATRPSAYLRFASGCASVGTCADGILWADSSYNILGGSAIAWPGPRFVAAGSDSLGTASILIAP